jgi:ABC-2 type transporter
MTAMFWAGWAGTSFISDMDRGVMDRNLTSPISRGALIGGSLAYQTVTTIVQSLIVFGVGLALGARFAGGVTGVLVMLLCAVLLALIFAALSDAVALLVHQQEALIAVSQFLTLPLVFLSSVMLAPDLMPGLGGVGVQPGELGRRRESRGAVGSTGLGGRGHRCRTPAGVGADHVVGGDARVPPLPGVGVADAVNVGPVRTRHQLWSGGGPT